LNATEAARALNGTINLDFSPLKVAGFDTVYELTRLAGFGSNTAEQSSTDIIRVIGQILVKNGVAETSNLRAQLSSGQMTAAGTADLATESLNMKLATIFSKEFTQKIGATRAGGVMNAAFTNSSGELVLPAIVTGAFKKPKFAPDLKALVELQKQRFLPGKENAADAVSKALGALTGKKDDTQKQDQPAEKKPSGLKGILDALGGKK
jgi:hypothetical protein